MLTGLLPIWLEEFGNPGDGCPTSLYEAPRDYDEVNFDQGVSQEKLGDDFGSPAKSKQLSSEFER